MESRTSSMLDKHSTNESHLQFQKILIFPYNLLLIYYSKYIKIKIKKIWFKLEFGQINFKTATLLVAPLFYNRLTDSRYMRT